jgi:hypothetical protein
VQDDVLAVARGRGPLQRLGLLSGEGCHDRGRRARERDVAVLAEVLLEHPRSPPLLDYGVGPRVEPGRGAPDLPAPLVQKPQAVALPCQADGLDGLFRLLDDGPHHFTEGLQGLFYILLGALGPRVVQLHPASLHGQHLSAPRERGGLHHRGSEVHTEDHLRIISSLPPPSAGQ